MLQGVSTLAREDYCDTVITTDTWSGRLTAALGDGEWAIPAEYGITRVDADADGFATSADCDDGDPSVNVGAAEVCGNGKDDDCDGADDADCDGYDDDDCADD